MWAGINPAPTVLAAAGLLAAGTAAAQPPSGAAGAVATPPGPASPGGYPLPSDRQLQLRAGAWDQSVRLEQQGQPEAARSLLQSAWGPQPSSYEVSLRIGWLSLSLEDAEQAVAAYEWASALPGADGTVRRGLGSALTLRGYAAFSDGDRGAAREDFRRALGHDPQAADARTGLVLARELRLDPELWLAFVGSSAGPERALGGSALLHLPLQVKDWLTLRLAYRHLEQSVTAPAPGSLPGPGAGRPGSGSASRWSQNDLFASVGMGLPIFWVDGWAMVLFQHDEDVVGGQAAHLRIGRRFGLNVEQAALFPAGGANVQLAPQAFGWPIEELGLGAGVRLTFDAAGEEISGVAGASVVTEPLEIHLEGHVGVERWPVSLQGPTVLTVDGDFAGGGKLTVLIPVGGREWALGLSGQLELLEVGQSKGIYGSAALGLRWSPEWFLKDGREPSRSESE